MINIFISYRRDDTKWLTGFLHDRLEQRFGRQSIFTDVDSIPLGVDFARFIDEQVSTCDLLLAVIGDRWLDATDKDGKRRLSMPDDFVRIEIESALNRDIPVIPVLVDDVEMPDEDRLPASIAPLVRRNCARIRPKPLLEVDIDRLIVGIEKHIPEAGSRDAAVREKFEMQDKQATESSKPTDEELQRIALFQKFE